MRSKNIALFTVTVLIIGALTACGSADDGGELSATTGEEPQLEAQQENVPADASAGGPVTITGVKHEILFTNDIASINLEDVVDYDGPSGCLVSLWGFNKEEDIRKLPDDVVTSLSQALTDRYKDTDLFSRAANDLPTDEGIYTAVCEVESPSGEKAYKLIVVAVDMTPPEISGLSESAILLSADSSSQTPTIDGNQVRVYDIVDGDLSVDDLKKELIVPKEGSSAYQIRVSYTDRAGNTTEQTVTIPEINKITGENSDGATEAEAQVQVATQTSVAQTAEPQVTTTTTTISGDAGFRNDFADQVLSLINQERANAGAGALSMNGTVQNAAGIRAVELTSNFSHTRPDGSNCFSALDQNGVGYGAAGENIAAGQSSPQAVVNSWMNSEGHRANILSGNFSQIGIACYYDPNTPYGYYWVQLFIG